MHTTHTSNLRGAFRKTVAKRIVAVLLAVLVGFSVLGVSITERPMIVYADAYTITYDGNGGTCPSSSEHDSSTPTTISTTIPERSGYSFAGWNTEEDGSGDTYQPGEEYSAGVDVVLYAQWKSNYTVSFDANGGTGAPAAATVTAGNSITLPSGPTLEGYNFAGWNTAADFSGITYKAGSTFTPTGDTTLYAVWTYTVTYVFSYEGQNGADVGIANEVVIAYKGETIRLWDEYVEGDCWIIEYKWRTTAWDWDEPETKYYYFGDPYDGGNITLYAVWSVRAFEDVYIYFIGEDCENLPAEICSMPENVNFIPDEIPTRDGYIFTGWNTEEDGSGETYQPGEEFAVSYDNVYLYAQWKSVNYIVSYDANGGTGAPESATYTHNQSALLPLTTPTYTGHTFLGWNTKQDGTGDTYNPGDEYSNYTSITLYAQWASDYTLSYDANGGTDAPESASITYDGVIYVTLDTPVYTGYSFVGWNTEIDGSGYWYRANHLTDDTITSTGGDYYGDDSFEPHENVTLYAQWASDYTLRYDANGGIDAPEPVTISYDAAIPIPLDTPSRDGYTFKEWNTKQDGSGTAYKYGDTYTAGIDCVLYAIWREIPKYTITYDANGGIGAPESISVPADTSTFVSSEKPIYNGHTFIGWNTKQDGSGYWYNAYHAFNPDIMLSSDDTYGDNDYEPHENVTLYAIWEANYTITYDANGGTDAPEATSIPYDVSAYVSYERPTYDKHTFIGWNTEVDGSGYWYNAFHAFDQSISMASDNIYGDNDYEPHENVTLYAIWESDYTITYDANDGENAPASTTAKYDVPTTLSAEIPSYYGYKFLSWNTAKDGSGTTYMPTAVYDKGVDVTLYAQWEKLPVYTVTYDANGGDDASVPAEHEFIHDMSTVISDGIPTRTGYTFNSWNVEDDGSGRTYEAGEEYAQNANLTLYAQWDAILYNLHYDANGGQGVPMSQVGIYKEEQPVSVLAPTRKGYEFLGWGSQTATKPKFEPGDKFTYPACDTTLYAVWKAIEYPITYDLDGGKNHNDNPDAYTIEDEVTFGKPTKKGYDFLGWYSDPEKTNEVTGIPAGSTGRVKVYAKWTPTIYNITYVLNDGTNDPSNPATYTIEDEVTFADATRPGYKFEGWHKENNTVTQITGLPLGSTGDVTLYAQWSLIDYDINYNLDGGTNNPSNPIRYTVEDEITFADPTKDGYVFDGWFSDPEKTNEVTGIPLGSTGDTDVYAKWTPIKYTITYVMGGGTNDPSNPDSYTVESDDIVFAEPTYRGHDFMGWIDSNGATVTGIPTGSTGDITVYANWGLHQYTITYVLNGGENDGRNVPFYSLGDTITLHPATREGYEFLGWHEAEDFSDAVITGYPDDTIGDKILYAEWKAIEYKINYHLNEGVNHPENPATYTIEDTITFKDPTREHYDFFNWYTDSSLSVQITGIPAGSTGDVDVYAEWNPKVYDVFYELDGGTNSGYNPSRVTYFDIVELDDPVKNGYTFDGWVNENGDPVTKLEETTSSITLTAKWTPIVYKITYVYNGGYKQTKNPTTYTIEDDFDLLGCYKPGDYVFQYWKTEDGKKIKHLADGRTGDLTLYAHYKYVEGSGNISATGDTDNSVAGGALITCGALIILASVVWLIINVINARKRKKNEDNEDA